jgi:GntR family transcriptional regulator
MAETAVIDFIEEMISLGFKRENILKKVESNLKGREDNE